MDGLIKKPAWHKGGWTGWGGGEEGGWVHRKALKPWGDRCRRGGGEGEDRWVEGWRKGARLKERGASRVYTGQVFRFHGIIKGSRATWNSISPSSSAVVDDGTSWDVPRMCFFLSFSFSFREEGFSRLLWDCCWKWIFLRLQSLLRRRDSWKWCLWIILFWNYVWRKCKIFLSFWDYF